MTAATGGAAYPRRNALNVLRLFMAALVVIDHAVPVGGFGSDPAVGRISLGAVAVFSFFGLSGFLITGSALREGGAGFIRNRVLRIFPGFWVCLVVTALVLAPISAALSDSSAVGVTWTDSLGYVVKNAALVVVQPGVGSTLVDAPHATDWNASLWTLPFEFGCYLLVLAASAIGVLRRPRLVYALTAVLGALAAPALVPGLAARYGGIGMHVCELVLMFACGACLRLQTTFALDNRLAGLAAFAICGVGIAASAHPVALVAVPLVYLLLCLGAQTDRPALIRHHDISYGLYIYGMPVEQVLGQTALRHHGLAVYTSASLAVTAVLASVSWVLVERPALRLKQRAKAAAPAIANPPPQLLHTAMSASLPGTAAPSPTLPALDLGRLGGRHRRARVRATVAIMAEKSD